jgi:hypothetical protein
LIASDELVLNALRTAIRQRSIPFGVAFAEAIPRNVYRQKEWDIQVLAYGTPQLLVPANINRLGITIVQGIPPPNGYAEYSYGYPVPIPDEFGVIHYGIPITGQSFYFQGQSRSPINGTISIDDIWVTYPNISGLPFDEPFAVHAYECTSQPN